MINSGFWVKIDGKRLLRRLHLTECGTTSPGTGRASVTPRVRHSGQACSEQVVRSGGGRGNDQTAQVRRLPQGTRRAQDPTRWHGRGALALPQEHSLRHCHTFRRGKTLFCRAVTSILSQRLLHEMTNSREVFLHDASFVFAFVKPGNSILGLDTHWQFSSAHLPEIWPRKTEL